MASEVSESVRTEFWLLCDLEPIANFDRYRKVHTATGKVDPLPIPGTVVSGDATRA